MRVWRLCSGLRHRFDGEGARITGGRWNLKGTAVVYTSATLSLAAAELFVHLSPEQIPKNLVSVSAEIPAELGIRTVAAADLPSDWRRYPAPESLAELGSAWERSLETAVLAVPSAVIPQETNYILNPAHPDFPRITVHPAEPFWFDPRMWKGKR